MNPDPMLLPMAALMAWTVLMGLVLVGRRAGDIRRQKAAGVALPGTRGAKSGYYADKTEAASDHFQNLFETPTLFYALCLGLIVAGAAGTIAVALAWAYVGLRIVHSLIHITYNVVMHRALVFFLSVGVLLALIALLINAALT